MKNLNGRTVSATAAADALDAPQHLMAYPAGPARIVTTWDSVAGASQYHVYRATSISGPYVLAGAPTAPPFIDTGLTPGVTYFYQVSAVAGETESALSNIAAATTDADIPAPSNIQAQAASCTEIHTTWEASNGAEGYQVYRSVSPAGPYQLVGLTASTTYIDTGLSPNTTYYYFVQAYIGDQLSPQSTTVIAATPPCETPVPPCQPCCPCCGCNPCCCPCRPPCSSCRR